MKFLKNSNSYDCGCIALANLFIWSGIDIDYEHQKHHFIKFLDWEHGYGVDREVFSKKLLGINKVFKCVEYKENPSFDYITKNLNKINIMVIGVEAANRTHVGLLLKITNNYAYLVNWDKSVIKKMSIPKFKKLISEWAIIFIIEKT